MIERPFADPKLREAYRALMRESAGPNHLDEASWEQLASGTANQSRRDELFDHVVSCEQCARVWRGLQVLQQQAGDARLIGAPAATSASWRARVMPLGLAAALVLAIGSLVLYRQGPGSASVDGVINRGTAVPEISGATYAAASRGFSWPLIDGASEYRVSVFTRDGQPVWAHVVATTNTVWPTAVTVSQGSYTWRVEALAGTSVIARSRLIDLDITR